MAIKIIKKRNADAPRPAPVVEPEPVAEAPKPAPKPAPRPAMPYREPILCSFCEHPYLEPCHGKSDRCMNAKWKRERLAAQEASK